MSSLARVLAVLLPLALTACGGGSDGGGSSHPPALPTYTVGGSITGLTGVVVLRNNGGDDLTLNSNTAFTFTHAIATGDSYDITVQTQPVDQTCNVAFASGSSLGSNVSNVEVTCTVNGGATTHGIGGNVTNLQGSIVLRNNGGDELTVSGTGTVPFTFGTPVNAGGHYAVTVKTQPTGQDCTLGNASGTANADVTNVTLTCVTNTYTVSGTLFGLNGAITLRNNGGDDITLSANGNFSFTVPVAHGSTYAVTVAAKPADQTCLVGNGSSTITANVTDVNVVCAISTWSVGGKVTGLIGALQVQNNFGNTTTITADGNYTFSTRLTHGSNYSITISTPSAGQNCSIAGGTATGSATAEVTNVDITCTNLPYTIGGQIVGVSDSITLQNNGGETITLTAGVPPLNASGNGSFQFATPVVHGATYDVDIVTPPGNRVCTIAYDTGTVDAGNIASVGVTCIAGAPAAPILLLDAQTNPREMKFKWGAVPGATFYRLYRKPDDSSGYTQTGGDIVALSVSEYLPVHLQDWTNGKYMLEACNVYGCTGSASIGISGRMLQAIGYFKAANGDSSDLFGAITTLSADGKTLVVSAPCEDSNGSGGSNDNSLSCSGAVYVFRQDSDHAWAQTAYLKASNPGFNNQFGYSLALSADGSTLAVGAIGEGSNATGINGDQGVSPLSLAGAVYVFTWNGSNWSQQAYVKASNTGDSDWFGNSVAISADGNTLAVGALGEASNATGIDGNQANNDNPYAGAVYVFTRSGATWSQQAYIKASNSGSNSWFGSSVVLAADGDTLAASALREDSNATGIDGDQGNTSAQDAGAVYVFTRSASTWSQQAYIKSSNTDANDLFGNSLAMTADGNRLVVGAYGEDSAATGIDGNQASNAASAAGAAYLFERSGGSWSQQAYIKASNTDAGDFFGSMVALSGDGQVLAVGASQEAGAGTGIGGDQSDDTMPQSGAVYVFTDTGSGWTQKNYVKANNTEAADGFTYFTTAAAHCLSLSGDGSVMAVGAVGEDSAARGVNLSGGGSLSDNSRPNSGAVYLY